METLHVADCDPFVENRFTLVRIAAARARLLAKGDQVRVVATGKPGVVALREIAAGKLSPLELEILAAAPRQAAETLAETFPDEDDVREALARSGAVAAEAMRRQEAVGEPSTRP